MSALVRTELWGRTAVLLLDNPPVNTGNRAQRVALPEALAALPADVDGFASPKWRGGPVRALSRQPEDDIVGTLAEVHASCPVTFALLEPATGGELPPAVAALFAHTEGKPT